MAIQGTLKETRFADLLQSIAEQRSTGVLHLKSKTQVIDIAFADGVIVRVDKPTRDPNELIGAMVLRAGFINAEQLEQALEMQRRSLRRLGDVLVAGGSITAERFEKIVRLQMTETLNALFSWEAGTFHLEAKEVELEQGGTPLLSVEVVLADGRRMLEQLPAIRKTISSDSLTFEKAEGPPVHEEALGTSERRVLSLVAPGVHARQIIDSSCLGEFETLKALAGLVDQGRLKIVGESPAAAKPRKSLPPLVGVAVQWVGSVLVVGGLIAGAVRLDPGPSNEGRLPAPANSDQAAQRFIARQQGARIEAALEIYRIESGELPDQLEALVGVGLLTREDLKFPWRDEYYYRRLEQGTFILLPPLH